MDGSSEVAGLLQQSVGALQRGDGRAALHAASAACHAAPEDGRAHYAYGQAWLVTGDPVRAAQAFAEAARLSPGWADAWVNLGVAQYRSGNIERAKAAMRRALQAAPGHAAATANLGAFMRISGEAEAAEALLRATLDREPGNVGVRLNLAADLLQEERAAEALALLDAAEIPADIAVARHWYLQRSMALLQLRRPGQAGMALGAFAALGPCPPALAALWRWRLVRLAQLDGDAEGAVRQATLMADALEAAGAQMLPEHRIMAHYDLAKFWSGGAEPARAMHHWTQGHRLLAAGQPFSRDSHAAFIAANIALLDRARFTAGPRATNADAAPVFIVGMPRSGTTLCEQILAAHHDAHGAGERAALGRMFAALGGGRDDADSVRRIAALGQAELDGAAERYLAELHALAPDRARIVDKMPGNYLHLGLIGLMLPGARVIHCVRDPRDIGLSIFTFRFHGSHPYAHDLADLGWTIAQQQRLMTHWGAALPHPVLQVRLSDWVEDFDATLARVLAHVGLPHDPACARFYEGGGRVRTVSYAQVRQPV
ncbi:MAG: sulfotransferase, partial [Acidisphaera sp.]|nr:sulfotransferase [Acidisphaera sp.]